MQQVEKSARSGRRSRLWLVAIFLISAYLSLIRLDNTAFWDDEAHISLMAHNFLQTGTWTGWDGRNLIAYNNGANLEANLRHIVPQLDAPVIAASFKIFGVSTWAGRFPFVVFGLLALALLGLLLKREFSQQPALCVFSFASLALSVHFLMAIRCCRYYALVMLFAVLVFGTYRQCLQRRRVFDFVLLGLWSILLFLSSCLNGAAFLMALVVVHLLFHRVAWSARDWQKALLTVVIFLCAAAPYAIVNRIWSFPIANTQPWYERKWWLLVSNFSGLNWVGLSWPIALGLVVFLWLRHRNAQRIATDTANDTDAAPVTSTVYFSTKNEEVLRRTILEWATLVLGYVFFLSMLSPLQINMPNDDALRYLYIILPWLAGLTGALLWFVKQRMPILAIAVFVILVATNFLSLTPWGGYARFLLPAYIAEIHQPYPTGYSEASVFLRRHARRDETVLAVPQHMNYPLMFYVGDHALFASLLDSKTHLPLQTVRALRAPLLREENFPHWFISFGTWPMTQRDLRYFSRPHLENGRNIQYSYRLAQTLDVFYEQTHRPEIPWHSFGPHRSFDRRKQAVYIYRRSAPQLLSQRATRDE